MLVGLPALPPRRARPPSRSSSRPVASGATSCRERAVLIVVRHGRTEANASGLLLGRRLDPALDDSGRRQAARARGRAARRGPRVVSSPLQRTRETAAALRPAGRRRRAVDRARLRRPRRHAAARRARATSGRAWQADPSLAPGGGESLVDLGERVRAACDDLAEEAADARRRRRHPRVAGEGGAGLGARRRRRGRPGAPTSPRRRSPASPPTARARRSTPSTSAPTSTDREVGSRLPVRRCRPCGGGTRAGPAGRMGTCESCSAMTRRTCGRRSGPSSPARATRWPGTPTRPRPRWG